MQLRAGIAGTGGGRGARAALRPAHADALLRMPRLRPHLLGRHPLAAHARGFRGTVKDVLRRLKAGELTEDEALDELRSIQLEDLAGRARLDLGRYLRRGIPEVVLAPGKTPDETARLAVTMAGRQGQGLVSRASKEHMNAVH